MAGIKPRPTTGFYLPVTGTYATIKNGGITEAFNGSAPEARVTFLVPADGRTELLGQIFGQWQYTTNCAVCWPERTASPVQSESQGNTVYKPSIPVSCYDKCCVTPKYIAKPYPFYDVDGNFFGNMWPTTYSMRPADPASGGTVYQVLSNGEMTNNFLELGEATTIATPPYTFSCPDSAGQLANGSDGNSTMVEIQVAYKFRNGWTIAEAYKAKGMAAAQVGGTTCEDLNDLLGIPANIFYDISMKADTDFQQIRGMDLEYDYHTGDPRSTADADFEDSSAFDMANAISIQNTSLTITLDNVPQVNEHILNDVRGTVNSAPFLGYPPEAVLFVDVNVTPRADWSGNTVYRMRYNFKVKTSECPKLTSWETASEYLAWYKGRIGLWNRRWNSTPNRSSYYNANGQLATKPNSQGGGLDYFDLYWIPVASRGGNGPYRFADWSNIFRYNPLCCG